MDRNGEIKYKVCSKRVKFSIFRFFLKKTFMSRIHNHDLGFLIEIDSAGSR